MAVDELFRISAGEHAPSNMAPCPANPECPGDDLGRATPVHGREPRGLIGSYLVAIHYQLGIHKIACSYPEDIR
jgi:hypothetical protein